MIVRTVYSVLLFKQIMKWYSTVLGERTLPTFSNDPLDLLPQQISSTWGKENRNKYTSLISFSLINSIEIKDELCPRYPNIPWQHYV